MDTRLIEIMLPDGDWVECTKEEFVSRFRAHAVGLRSLGMDIVEQVVEEAGQEFERIHKCGCVC